MRNKSTRKSSLDTSSMPQQKAAHPPVQRISASLAYVALVLRPTSFTSKWRTLKVRKTQINTYLVVFETSAYYVMVEALSTPVFSTLHFPTPDFSTPDFSTMKFSTPDFLIMNFSTPNFSTLDFPTPILGLKNPGLESS